MKELLIQLDLKLTALYYANGITCITHPYVAMDSNFKFYAYRKIPRQEKSNIEGVDLGNWTTGNDFSVIYLDKMMCLLNWELALFYWDDQFVLREVKDGVTKLAKADRLAPVIKIKHIELQNTFCNACGRELPTKVFRDLNVDTQWGVDTELLTMALNTKLTYNDNLCKDCRDNGGEPF